LIAARRLSRGQSISGQGRCDIAEALVSFLIFLIVVIVIAAIILWAVSRFFPEVYPPARLIVGAVALIAVLWALLRVIQAGVPGLP
jgi:hypothetical protein